MKYFKKISSGVNVRPLVKQLDANPQLWDAITLRKTAPGSPHTRMSDIWVRYNDLAPFASAGSLKGLSDKHVPIWYPAWKALPALKPIVFGLMAKTQGEMLGGILITRIPPGVGIDPHTDHGWHVEYYDKFYVSLKSAPGATFHCGDESLNPKPGDVYLFDNRAEHWVINNSNEDRITLIVCIRTELYGRK